MINLFAGLDVSTQSCKLVVVDLDKNIQVHLDSINYDKDLPKYKTLNGTRQEAGFGVSESDPKMWLEAINILASGKILFITSVPNKPKVLFAPSKYFCG